jgi:hypothetical protein
LPKKVSKKERKQTMRKNILSIICLVIVAFFAGNANAETPLGYPWSTWGEVTQTLGNTNTDRGFTLDGYAEQGIDWVKVGKTDWTLNTFLGVRGIVSDHKTEWWRNKIGPWVGLKLKHSLIPFAGSWGEVNLGTRVEYYDYLGGHEKNETRAVLFFQWSLGGDWKRR